jgi:hypothetical protein
MKFSVPVYTVAAVVLASLPSQAQVISGFQGPYAPANWTFTSPGLGIVNTAAAPASITLIGTDGPPYYSDTNTNYVTTAVGAGSVQFQWNYSSVDIGSDYDRFYYLLNGVQTFLAQNSSQGSGTTVFSVLAGDTFGFRVYSEDSGWGPGVAVIYNFSAPVPGPLPLFGAAAAYSFSRRLRQRTRLGS